VVRALLLYVVVAPLCDLLVASPSRKLPEIVTPGWEVDDYFSMDAGQWVFAAAACW
jgi:hypothetical protein